MTQVLIYEASYARIAARLKANLPDLDVVLMQADGTLRLRGEVVQESDLALTAAWANNDLFVGGPTRDFMIAVLRSPTVRWVQSGAAGFDHPVFGMLVDKGVTLSNSHATAPGIAEFVVASVLSHYHPQAQQRALQNEHTWQRTLFREISGGTWLVIGIGHIGCEVATRARAFGARVIGVRRSPTGAEPVDVMLPPSEMKSAASEADVVVVCAASNAESVHLIDADFLSRMKPDSVLVNVARGSLVDEAALLASLDRGVPQHAALDVFAVEPLPADSPLWTHPRVAITAHCAAGSDGLVRRGDQLFIDNVVRHARGEQPSNVVDAEDVLRSVQGNQS